MQIAPNEIEEGNIEYKRYFFKLLINTLRSKIRYAYN